MRTELKPLFIPPKPPSVERMQKSLHVVPSSRISSEDIEEIADITQLEVHLGKLLEAYGLDKKPKTNRRVWHAGI